MLLRILLISLAVSAVLSSKTINRRRLGAATCHHVIDDKSCKNATEPSTCTTFADSYKSGTCEANGYSVACKLRYDIVLNYKDAASCKTAQDKALHRRMAATCFYFAQDKSYCKQADSSVCKSEGSYKAGDCKSQSYPVECKLRYGMALWYKDAASCKAAQDKALHRRMADTCFYFSADKSSCKQAEGHSCKLFSDSYTAGDCKSQSYPVKCKLRYGIALWYKDAASCKAAQDKALHRRMAATCFYFAQDKSYCKQADSSVCKSEGSYKAGDCKSQSYPVECKLRYGMALWYKDDKSCKAAQDKALHRRMAATCYRVNKDGYCKNAAEADTCTTFKDTYKSGTCEANGYSVACKLRYNIVLNYKDAAACKAAKEKALH